MSFRVVVLVCITASVAGAQEVDLVRLGYADKEVSAQIAMAATADGRHLAFLFADGITRIFDVTASRFIKRFKGPSGDIFDFYVTTDKRVLYIAKTEVQVWSWEKEEHAFTLPLSHEATKVAYSVAHNLLAVGQSEGNTVIFDIAAGKLIREIQYKQRRVTALAFHPTKKLISIGIMTMPSYAALKLFDIGTGNELASSGEKDWFFSAAFDRAGNRIVAWGGRWGYYVFDANDLHLLKKSSESGVHVSHNQALGLHICDENLLMLTDTRAFNVSDLRNGSRLFTTTTEKSPANLFTLGRLGVGSFSIFPLNATGDKVIVNTTRNNINQIYDVKKNAMVGYFFADANEDFAIVSRDGRVEGTQGAMNKVYWTSRASRRKTSLESTFEKGFTPRLLPAIINGDEATTAFEVDDIIDRIPVLRLKSVTATAGRDSTVFESSQKVVRAEIAIRQGAGEVTDVKLFQNAKLVRTLPSEGKSVFTFDIALTSTFGEANYFYVTAGSKSGIESEKLKFTIFYKGVSDARPRLFLLTIGINNYKNPKYNLNYAEADANGVADMISGKAGSLFADIIRFSIRNDSAVKPNILAVLDRIRAQSLEQDMLVVYYAGHGVMSEGISKAREFFLVPHDVTQLYGREEVLFERAISATELKVLTQQINAQKQVFILDACQSSGALEAMESRMRGAAEEKAIAQLARSTGTFWITSTGADQFASEFEKLGHGIFTYALLEGIEGDADANGDGRVTIRELSAYIENKVPELSEELKGSAQYPSAYSFGNDFPLVVYR